MLWKGLERYDGTCARSWKARIVCKRGICMYQKSMIMGLVSKRKLLHLNNSLSSSGFTQFSITPPTDKTFRNRSSKGKLVMGGGNAYRDRIHWDLLSVSCKR